MQALQAFIIDDDTHSREYLKNIIADYFPEVKICGEYSTIKDAVSGIKLKCPELIFLDMQLEDGIGIDLLDFFPEPDFITILITGHEAYGIQALKRGVLDYILKPYNPKEISDALTRADKILEKRNALGINVFKDDLLLIRTATGIIFQKIEDIVRMESDGNYTRIFMANGESILTSKTLKTYEALLNTSIFLRAHRSHIVNINFVKEYRNIDSSLVFIDGMKIEVSQRAVSQIVGMIGEKRKMAD